MRRSGKRSTPRDRDGAQETGAQSTAPVEMWLSLASPPPRAQHVCSPPLSSFPHRLPGSLLHPWAQSSRSCGTLPPVPPPLQPTAHILGIWCFNSVLKRGGEYIMERNFHATSCFSLGASRGSPGFIQSSDWPLENTEAG